MESDLEKKKKIQEYDKAYNAKHKKRKAEKSHTHYISVRRKQFIANPALYLWKVAKVRAKKFGIEFSIDPEDVVLPEFCPIIGCKLIKGDGHRQDAPSLDRVDNTKGYILKVMFG